LGKAYPPAFARWFEGCCKNNCRLLSLSQLCNDNFSDLQHDHGRQQCPVGRGRQVDARRGLRQPDLSEPQCVYGCRGGGGRGVSGGGRGHHVGCEVKG
jgi:hypothetical protein